jgi:hypothetical protein
MGIALGVNSYKPEMVEAEINEGCRRLRRVAPALVIWANGVPQKRLPNIGVFLLESASPNQLILFSKNQRELIPE